MAKKKQKKKNKAPEQAPRPKDFLDMIAPAAVKFNTVSHGDGAEKLPAHDG